jgi:nicotinamide mononucleotide transporter
MLNFYQILEWLGAAIGFIYLYYQYKANPKLWIFGGIMSIIYITVYLHAKVYFWAAINVYYLCIQLYSTYNWEKLNQKEDSSSGISHFPVQKRAFLLLFTATLSVVLSIIAIKFTDSPIPIPEGISTAMSFVAMYLLAKKYMEHWLIWILVDVFYTFYNAVLGLYGTTLLYVAYTVVAVMGYFKWRKLYKNQ